MTPQTFKFFSEYLYDRSGLSLQPEKQYLLENRLTAVLRDNDISSFDDLAAKVRSQPQSPLGSEVVECMTVNETSFFRDRTPFERFTERMLPDILANRSPADPLRIWSAAASSGQEAYTIAMLCKENAKKIGPRRIEIIGTDLSNAVIAKAKAGLYSQFEVQRGLPTTLLLKYFEQVGEMWTLTPEIKSMVQFKQFNLTSSYSSLPRFDIIFCRNVLIYFDVETKCGVFKRLRSSLAPDGFLVLGAAETTIGLSTEFSADGSNRVLFRPASYVDAGNKALSA